MPWAMIAAETVAELPAQIMVEKWHIKPDVAGATFMAAPR